MNIFNSPSVLWSLWCVHEPRTSSSGADTAAPLLESLLPYMFKSACSCPQRVLVYALFLSKAHKATRTHRVQQELRTHAGWFSRTATCSLLSRYATSRRRMEIQCSRSTTSLQLPNLRSTAQATHRLKRPFQLRSRVALRGDPPFQDPGHAVRAREALKDARGARQGDHGRGAVWAQQDEGDQDHEGELAPVSWRTHRLAGSLVRRFRLPAGLAMDGVARAVLMAVEPGGATAPARQFGCM